MYPYLQSKNRLPRSPLQMLNIFIQKHITQMNPHMTQPQQPSHDFPHIVSLCAACPVSRGPARRDVRIRVASEPSERRGGGGGAVSYVTVSRGAPRAVFGALSLPVRRWWTQPAAPKGNVNLTGPCCGEQTHLGRRGERINSPQPVIVVSGPPPAPHEGHAFRQMVSPGFQIAAAR